MIKNLNEAYDSIKTYRKGVPFEAIKFIRSQPKSDEIIEKIVFALEHAYDRDVYADVSGLESPEPLWYAVIAEQFPDLRLVDPVICLFVNNDSWDFLDEQGMFLIGQLAEKFPDTVPEKVLSAIENQVKNKSGSPFFYLYDAFYYIDKVKSKTKLLDLLENDDKHIELLAGIFANIKFNEAIPFLENQAKHIKKDGVSMEYIDANIKDALEKFKSGLVKPPYFKRRNDWEKYYLDMERYFDEDNAQKIVYTSDEDGFDEGLDEGEKVQTVIKDKTPGRNDPCSCGSGKKYKKCCMGK